MRYLDTRTNACQTDPAVGVSRQSASRYVSQTQTRTDTSTLFTVSESVSQSSQSVNTVTAPTYPPPPPTHTYIILEMSDDQTVDHSVIVQELCESRGGRPGLSVLTSLLISVDVKIY